MTGDVVDDVEGIVVLSSAVGAVVDGAGGGTVAVLTGAAVSGSVLTLFLPTPIEKRNFLRALPGCFCIPEGSAFQF